jgi:hypothetical protein
MIAQKGCAMEPKWYRRFAERHPYVTFFVTLLIIWLPSWISNLWSLFSERPFFPAVASAVRSITQPEFSPYFITVPVAFGMFAYLIYAVKNPIYQYRDNSGKAPSNKSVEFFGTYAELERKYPRSEILKSDNELHGYFLSGEGLMGWNLEENIKRFRRIILPQPTGSYLHTLQTLCVGQPFMNPYLRGPDQIKTTTAAAQRNSIPLRWFDDYFSINVLICNPDGDDGWVHISMAMPLLEPERQHTYRLEKKNHPSEFKAIYEAYERLWTQSITPRVNPTLPNDQSGSPVHSSAHEFLSMKQAAIDLYSEVREKKHVLAKMAERSSGRNLTAGSPDDILDQMATYIAISKKVSVHGKRVPSNRREQISSNDVRASHFTEGATKLVNIHKQSMYFTDLEIKRSDFDDVIDEVQIDDGFYR